MRHFVGRGDELRELEDGIESAASGVGRLFVLTGEPGIGKTRLADVVAARAKTRGFVVHWGRCSEVGGAPAFWPWIQIFRSLGRDPATEKVTSAYGDVLARLLPELRSDGDAPHVDDAQARFRLFDELWALLRAVTEHVPLVLVLDDVHAADPSSMALLRLVARDLRQTRVLVVTTSRDREAKPEASVSEAIHAISREGTPLGLRRLDVDEVGAFLAAHAGHDVPRSLIARVQTSTDGNPLFVDQVCRLLVAKKGLESTSAEVPVPAALRDAIRGRLNGFDPVGRAVLEAAAVLGRDFTIPLVASVLGSSDAEVASWVKQGIEAGLLQELGVAQYEICHALFRETLYRDLVTSRRAELHAKAAEALEKAAATERGLGEVARHLLEGLSVVGPQRALAGCMHAAERALVALAFEDAASILTSALAELGSSIDARARAEALVLLGTAHARTGEREPARKACEEAAAIARSLADNELLARAALALGAELMPGVVSTPLIALLEEARGLSMESSSLRARVLARLAAALQPASDPNVPIAMAREAVAMARAGGDPETLRNVLFLAGSALVDFGDPAERIGWDSELLELAEQHRDPVGVLRARVRLFFDYVELGRPEEMDAQLEAHAETADRLGLQEHQWRTVTMRTLRAIWDGRYEDVETYRAQARRLASRARIAEAPVVTLLQDVGIALSQGKDIPRVEEIMARLKGFPGSDEVDLAMRAFQATYRGDLDEGRSLAARIPQDSVVFTGLHPGVRFLVDVAAHVNDTALAEHIHRLSLPYATRIFSWGRVAMFAEGPMTWLLGSLTTTMGRLDEAERYFEDALARVHEIGMRPYEAVVCFDYARLLRARGPAGASKLAEITARGMAVAQAIGATALLKRFESATYTMPRVTSEAPPSAAPTPAGRAQAETPSKLAMSKDGDVWAIDFQSRTLRLKDSRGMQILAQLVESPGREFHVLTLVGSEGADGGDAGEVLDKKAQQAYRARAEDLREQLAEAESFHDPARAAALRSELERLGEELASAVGLGGRTRRTGGAAEKARVNVQKRLRDTIRRVAEQDRSLGRQLERSVRTGTFCAYEPE